MVNAEAHAAHYRMAKMIIIVIRYITLKKTGEDKTVNLITPELKTSKQRRQLYSTKRVGSNLSSVVNIIMSAAFRTLNIGQHTSMSIRA